MSKEILEENIDMEKKSKIHIKNYINYVLVIKIN